MNAAVVRVGKQLVGEGQPVYVIAEIGINHNGDVNLACRMIEKAARAGANAVKFQKRTPELSVPPDQRDLIRDTPWGPMTYLEYRRRVELGLEDYRRIDECCRRSGIEWFVSPWDIPSVDFVEAFDPPCHKVASASLTDHELLARLERTGRPIILSTGMSTLEEIEEAVAFIPPERLLIAHSTSAYPCPVEALNLRMIATLKERYPRSPIGYSGHEVGLAPTWAAVAIGATFIERHVTLDRSMWGSDQAASVEMGGLARLIENVRDIEKSLGDGVKSVYSCELNALRRLRRVTRTPVT